MANIDFGNGQVVKLSKETTERLRKELLKPTPPKDFECGLFRMKIDGGCLVIDSDYQSDRMSTYVYRDLRQLKVIRNQLDLFINYLEEIEDECTN